MTRSISLIGAVVGAALLLAPSALGDAWFADRQDPVRVSPDLVDRSVAADQREQAAMLDARERSATERPGGSVTISSVEARERAFGAKLQAHLGTGNSTDVVQRAVDARGGSILEPVRDDRFRLDPTSGPAPVSVASGRDLEWPQIGIGFLIGLLLATGLYLTMRLTRIRPLAH